MICYHIKFKLYVLILRFGADFLYKFCKKDEIKLKIKTYNHIIFNFVTTLSLIYNLKKGLKWIHLIETLHYYVKPGFSAIIGTLLFINIIMKNNCRGTQIW